jgi:hypothetical protein
VEVEPLLTFQITRAAVAEPASSPMTSPFVVVAQVPVDSSARRATPWS